MPDRDLMWLAGLLEGEGWFGLSHYKTPVIQVSMTDRDVIERAAALLGNKVAVEPKRSVRKQAWTARVYGHKAVEMMRQLHPHMGARRSERIAELLSLWDAVEHKAPKGAGRSAAKCHPDMPVTGGGLCANCYARRYRRGWRVRSAT